MASPAFTSLSSVTDITTGLLSTKSVLAENSTVPSLSTAEWVIPVVYTCLLIVTNLALNGLLAFTITFLNRRKFRPGHLIILCISVTDILVAVIYLPSLVVAVAGGTEQNCRIVCGVLVVTERALIAASVWGMAFVSCDRYFFIVKHGSYRTVVTYRRCVLVLTGVFMMAFLFGSTSFFVLTHQRHVSGRCLCHLALDFHGFHHLVYSATYITMCFILPTTIMLILYGFVIKVARRNNQSKNPFRLCRSNAVDDTSAPPNGHFKQQNNTYKAKTARILFVILTLYLIFYIPYFVLNILASTGHWEPDGIPQVLYVSSALLLHTNSSCNPLFYGFTNRKIRTSVMKFLKLDKKSLPKSMNADKISVMGDAASNGSDISALSNLSREGLASRDIISIYQNANVSRSPVEHFSCRSQQSTSSSMDFQNMSETISISSRDTDRSFHDAGELNLAYIKDDGYMDDPKSRHHARLKAMHRLTETAALFAVQEEDCETVLSSQMPNGYTDNPVS